MTRSAEALAVGRGSAASGLLYLGAGDVAGLLPPVDEQLALVEQTFRGLAAGQVQLPPKPAIHPRDDAFIHAMPTYLTGPDVAALKWIGGSSGNGARGLPYLSGLIILNDPTTALPLAIIDAADITAARTAAVTGFCVRRFAPPDWRRVAIVGYGVQGRAHAKLLEVLNPNVEIAVCGAEDAAGSPALQETVAGADVVVTAIRFEHPAHPFLEAAWLQDIPLLVPIDFDATIRPEAIRRAGTFIVDDLDTFAYYRGLDYFKGWPDPQHALPSVLDAPRPGGPVVCCNLGLAALDAAYAIAVLRRARAQGVGTTLA